MRQKLSLDAEQAQAPPRSDAGRRALTTITLATAALALAACSRPAAPPLGSSPAAASSAEAVTLPTAPAAATQTLPETGSTVQGSAVRARDLRAFLSWAITSGAAQLAQVNFQPLPSSVVTLSGTQIAQIKG